MTSEVLKNILIIVYYFIFLLCSPLILFVYLLLCVRARVVALVLSYKNLTFVDGSDTLSGIDVDTTDHLMQTYILLDGKVDVNDVRRVVTTRLISPRSQADSGGAAYPRLQRFVQLRSGHLVWRDDPNFRIEDHVIERRGEPPTTPEELRAVVNCLVNGRMASDTSGWEFILVHFRFAAETGSVALDRTCMVMRVNHCIMDGMTFVRLFMERLADNSAVYRKTFDRNMAVAPPAASPCTRLLRHLLAVVHAPYVQLRTLVRRDLNDLHDSRRPLTGKKLFVTEILSLADVKAIKNRLGATVNDVIMSCVAGGLRRYLTLADGKGDSSLHAHAMIPVHFQRPDQPLTTKNFFAVAVVELAADPGAPLDRLRRTKMIMDRLKTSLDLQANRLVGLSMSNVLPKCLVDAYFRMAPMTMCVTNIRGPDVAIRFCGRQVTNVNIVPSHFYTTGVSYGVISYLNEMFLTLNVDSGIVSNIADIRKILNCFLGEFEDLKSSAMQIISGTDFKNAEKENLKRIP